MSETKPVVVVDAQYRHHGERWHSYVFKVDKYPKPLVAYGDTQKVAEERMHTELRAVFGAFNYSIQVVE